MDKNYIQSLIEKNGNKLFPEEGDFISFNIDDYQKLVFSEIYKIKLSYKNSEKKIVIKKYLHTVRGTSNLASVLKNEYDTLTKLYQDFSAFKNMGVVKPITLLQNKNILIMEDCPGLKLNVFINQYLRWFPSKEHLKKTENYFYSCGQWLKEFQKNTNQSETFILTKKNFLDNIERKIANLKTNGIAISLGYIQNYVEKKFKNQSHYELEMTGYHKDFVPWNILVQDNEINVMDFDRFSHGTKYDDLTLFLTTLDGVKTILGINKNHIDKLKSSFLEGYGLKPEETTIFNLHLLKNTLKALSMIPIENSNTGFIDLLYEKYRKKRSINFYLKKINKILTGNNTF